LWFAWVGQVGGWVGGGGGWPSIHRNAPGVPTPSHTRARHLLFPRAACSLHALDPPRTQAPNFPRTHTLCCTRPGTHGAPRAVPPTSTTSRAARRWRARSACPGSAPSLPRWPRRRWLACPPTPSWRGWRAESASARRRKPAQSEQERRKEGGVGGCRAPSTNDPHYIAPRPNLSWLSMRVCASQKPRLQGIRLC
jgi:hypothetical protein